MRLIKKSTLLAFAAKHEDAADWLRAWAASVNSAQWQSIADVRRDYPKTDRAAVSSGGTVVIFYVKGNEYRLIVAIHYNAGRVYVRDFLTHAEYDNQKWKNRH